MSDDLPGDSKGQLSPSVAAACVVGVAAWMAIYFWLARKADWPNGYGYPCDGNGCLFVDAWHSPALLLHANAYSLGLFAWYAVMITATALVILRAARRMSRGSFLFAAALLVVGFIGSLVAR